MDYSPNMLRRLANEADERAESWKKLAIKHKENGNYRAAAVMAGYARKNIAEAKKYREAAIKQES